MDLDMKSEAGLVRGQLMTDLRCARLRVRGSAPRRAIESRPHPEERRAAERHHRRRAHRPDASLEPVGRAGDRIGSAGTFTFRGPRALALGYAATDVRAKGSFKGPRVTLARRRRARLRRVRDGTRAHRSAGGPATGVLRPAGHRRGRRPAAAPRVDEGAEARHRVVAGRLPRQGNRHDGDRLGHAQRVAGRRRDDCTRHGRRLRQRGHPICVRGAGDR